MVFHDNKTIQVTALDALAVNAGGSQVRLFNSSGTTLASATVTSSDPLSGSPTAFFSHAITPVTLQAGQTYFIVEDINNTTLVSYLASGLTVNPLITFGNAVSGPPTTNPMTATNPSGVANSFFGPNFEATAVVPEPATMALFGLCVVGAGAYASRRRKQAQAA